MTAGISQLRSVILGTAGHIDHGKTALVKALTGIDTDRLQEEQRRGITIELGFAHLRLDDVLFGVVDVPGHERFIKSMVAGAGGLDLVMLVVAADEGVMPQTREHVDICQLLAVQRGLVALTKADLVDREWLELVQEDLREVLAPTFLGGAPLVPCSALSGAGLRELERSLLELARDCAPRDAGGLVRLPLDRVFTIKGFGTVVTGTLLAGTLRTGDDVAILPTALRAKVRSIQVHGAEVSCAVAGQRTAVNLGGVDRHEVARGEVLVHPETLAPSSMIDALVSLLPGTRNALGPRSKVLFHIGTQQQEALCTLLVGKQLAPGETALAQLHFAAPIVALPGDRFILRGFQKQENYGTTIGGGEVLRVLARRLRPKHQHAIALLERVSASRTQPRERVALELLGAGPRGLTRAELQQRLPLVPSALAQVLDELAHEQPPRLVIYDAESGAAVHAEPLAALRERLLAIVAEFHRQRPLEAGLAREELRSRLGAVASPRLFAVLLGQLEAARALVVERELCRLPGHTQHIAGQAVQALAARLLAHYMQAGLAPPREATLAEELHVRPAEIAPALKALVEQRQLVRVGELYFAQAALAALQAKLVAFLEQNGQISPAQFKELVGQSRKFAIPLAEYFDAQKVTLRVGDQRKLRR